MFKSVAGIYRDGRIDLLEPASADDGTRVIVTFVEDRKSVELAARGIDAEQAIDLQHRLNAFSDDWSRADMDVYDEEQTG